MHRCNAAPRCRAKSKRTGLLRADRRTEKGYRICRMQGAGGGDPKGEPNGNFRHGESQEATGASRYIDEFVRLLRRGIKSEQSVSCSLALLVEDPLRWFKNSP